MKVLVDGVMVEPFSLHPRRFRKRGEYAAWYMAMFPSAPAWAHLAACGDEPAIYLRESERLNRG